MRAYIAILCMLLLVVVGCSNPDTDFAGWAAKELGLIGNDSQNMVRKLCRRAGIRGGPHKLRHTAATNYLRNGGTEFTLQIMLGHSTLNMTRRYSRTLNSDDMMRIHEKASPVDRMNIK
jgi:integrase